MPVRKNRSRTFRSASLATVLAVIVSLAAAPAAAQAPGAGPRASAQGPVAEPRPDQGAPPYDSVSIPLEGQRPEAAERVPTGFEAAADRAMGGVNAVVSAVLFYDLMFWDDAVQLPFIVLWLVVAAVFLTFRMRFINLRGFGHAVGLVRGKYSKAGDTGEVSHFQALTTALSATVGLGNIAGVAIAVSIGGPGATFWMIIAGLLGMTTKLTECTLGQMYREVRPDGSILGGPMQYLSKGLAELRMRGLGRFLAVTFAILCIGGSLGGGNSFQVNQSLNAMQETVPLFAEMPWLYGAIMTFLVGIVIIGGIRRIAQVAEKIVPLMVGIYVIAAIAILLMNASAIPAAFSAIFHQAFAPDAAYGGFIGVLVTGFRRAAFSNEAGAGSAAIAHSAARTEYPIREGLVALLEPFIDTVVVCTMTALVIVITGAYNNPEYADLVAGNKGAALTSRAMGEDLSFFPYILSLAVFLFAYSTMISWSYYGERSWVWMFGDRSSMYYRVLFLIFVFLGSIITAANVLEFGDLMILGMALPNLIGVYLLHGKVRAALADYWRRWKAGEFVQNR